LEREHHTAEAGFANAGRLAVWITRTEKLSLCYDSVKTDLLHIVQLKNLRRNMLAVKIEVLLTALFLRLFSGGFRSEKPWIA
jgi:hypothetical protein